MGEKVVHNKLYLALLAIIAAHIVILQKIIFFPYPELFVYPYLTKIGLIPYAQILDQHFPGIMFLPINLATLGFTTVDSMRVLSAALVVISHVLLFLCARQLFSSKAFILAPNILFLFWNIFFDGSTVWIESFVAPLLLASFYLSRKTETEKESRNNFFAGLALGIALAFKQVVLPIAAILAVFQLVSFKKHKFYIYLSGLMIPILVVAIFVFSKGILNDFIYWTATFNLAEFAQMGRKFATPRELLSTSFLVIPALASILYLWRKKVGRKAVFELSVLLLGSFAFAYARFDFIHLQPMVLFAIIAICWAGSVLPKKYQYLLIIFTFFTAVLGLRSISRQLGDEVRFFTPTDIQVFNEVDALADDLDPVFAFGAYPHIYSATQTRPSGNVFVFQFSWFMKVAEPRVLSAIMADPPRVVVRDKTPVVDGYTLADYMQNIARFIDRYYVVHKQIGNTEILLPR